MARRELGLGRCCWWVGRRVPFREARRECEQREQHPHPAGGRAQKGAPGPG